MYCCFLHTGCVFLVVYVEFFVCKHNQFGGILLVEHAVLLVQTNVLSCPAVDVHFNATFVFQQNGNVANVVCKNFCNTVAHKQLLVLLQQQIEIACAVLLVNFLEHLLAGEQQLFLVHKANHCVRMYKTVGCFYRHNGVFVGNVLYLLPNKLFSKTLYALFVGHRFLHVNKIVAYCKKKCKLFVQVFVLYTTNVNIMSTNEVLWKISSCFCKILPCFPPKKTLKKKLKIFSKNNEK